LAKSYMAHAHTSRRLTLADKEDDIEEGGRMGMRLLLSIRGVAVKGNDI
jgi:hypothetical protein